jgi:hypothetical protein
MTVSKTILPSSNDVTSILSVAAKVITSISTYKHGSVEVVDILCTDTNHYYLKTSQGQVEVGGTPDWGSGTKIGGR